MKKFDVWPASRPNTGPVDLQQRLAVRVAPRVQVVVRLDRRALVGPQAHGLEDPGDLVVEVHRPRHRVEVRPPLKDGDAVPGPAE